MLGSISRGCQKLAVHPGQWLCSGEIEMDTFALEGKKMKEKPLIGLRLAITLQGAALHL